MPAPSFNVISPFASNKSNALASFVASFGTAITAPSFKSSMFYTDEAYNPRGSK